MNTTFVLHGGYSLRESKDNEAFYKLFTTLVEKDHVKILLCYFAQEKIKWDNLFNQHKSKIIEQSDKEVEIYVANDTRDLLRKLETSDVLFVEGGKDYLIEPQLPKLRELDKAINGKVYLGSSMGAFIVCKNYVLSFMDQDVNHVHEGLGIVPFNALCHWNVEPDKTKKIKMLKDKDAQTPIAILDDEKFSIFVK